MKLGIFGGTFNPIHNGHIDIGLKIYNKLSLNKVLFMPNKIPPHKKFEEILSDKIRLSMLKEALKEYDFFDVEEYELNKNEISYTYESLEHLSKIYKDDELFFIIGSDSFLNFDSWKKIERIFKSANVVVYLRNDYHKERVFEIKENYKKLYNGKIHLVIDDIINISSTKIRDAILNGDNINNLVPKGVYEYIVSKNLYGE